MCFRRTSTNFQRAKELCPLNTGSLNIQKSVLIKNLLGDHNQNKGGLIALNHRSHNPKLMLKEGHLINPAQKLITYTNSSWSWMEFVLNSCFRGFLLFASEHP